MAETSKVICSSPVRPKRVLVCPPAPIRKTNQNRRPSFFEPSKLDFDNDDENILRIKTQMVRNSLKSTIRITFHHTKEFSDKIAENIGCSCERIDDNTCVYYNY